MGHRLIATDLIDVTYALVGFVWELHLVGRWPWLGSGLDLGSVVGLGLLGGAWARQAALQYLTWSQSRAHFLRQVNGRPQVAQGLEGRLGLAWGMGAFRGWERVGTG